MLLRKKKFWVWLIIFLIFLWIFWLFKFADNYPHKIDLESSPDFWGVTFSHKFATELGLDWQEAYLATLDDLQVKNIRLPIYWDQIEKNQGEFNFADYDFMFEAGHQRNVKFIANIGWRTPRWPECHAPEWTKNFSLPETKRSTLDMLKVVVEKYKDNPDIIAWQVENEPLLDLFGKCPDGDADFLKQEVDLVKSLDARPIIVSASGELATWHREGKLGDVFATTMYRVVWNSWFGYSRYPLPAGFYKLKAKLSGIDPGLMIISELQTEPWVPNGTLADPNFINNGKSFNLDQFKANLQYAINTDLQKVYLWGAEWWYQQYKNGDPSYWALAKTLFLTP